MLLIYFWLCWVFTVARAFSLAVVSWDHSLVWHAGFLLWRLLLLRHRLSRRDSWLVEHRFSDGGTWAERLRCIWDLPRPGITPVSSALAGGLYFWAMKEALVIDFSVFNALQVQGSLQMKQQGVVSLKTVRDTVFLFFIYLFFDRVFLKYFLEILFCPLFFSTECGNSGLVFKIMGCRDCNRIASE